MARAREVHSHSVDEAVGLSLLGLGTLLFLALISYHPRDVPTWFPLHSIDPANRHTLNFIGPAGAILACVFYALLGAASYLVAALLLGLGGVKLLAPSFPLSRRAGWCAAFVIAGACLAELLPFSFLDSHLLNIEGEGGWIGKWLGGALFGKMLGSVGAGLVLSVLYAVSLMLATGLRPLAVMRFFFTLPRKLGDRAHAWRVARADDQKRLGLEAQRLEREARRLERELRRKGADLPSPAEMAALPASPQEEFKLSAEPPAPEEPPRPAPQIIDANAASPERKAKKKDKFQPLTPISAEGYELPSLSLLDEIDLTQREAANPDELLGVQQKILDTLAQFSIGASPGDITRGPTITRYEVYPAYGIRVDRIANLERDIARATRAERINILAPIPGKDTVGIEIANSKKQKVTLRELLEGDDFHNTKSRIPLALGKDVYGHTVIADLAAMPHLLVAGTTGSGKSVCINAIVASLLYRFTPADLRLIMIDPKVVEMQQYNSLPHLVVPVVTDPKKVLLALRWACDEMDKRYEIFARTGVRNIGGFNARPLPKTQAELDAEAEGVAPVKNGAGGKTARPAEALLLANLGGQEPTKPPQTPSVEETTIDFDAMSDEELFDAPAPKRKVSIPRDDDIIIPDRMPYIVIIVDELADLMQTAPADVESAIARLTQKARAAGIHMIIATQTPRADVITGVIKANVPCRIAFQVSSPLDSRVILDENGAERLLGQGDMLYRPPGTAKMLRTQGVLVTDEEVHRLVEHASQQQDPQFEGSIHERLSADSAGDEEEVSDEDEELVQKCLEVMRQEKKASTSLFQRRLRLGYTRAARILDILEARGFVGPGEGAKPREILRDLDAL